LNQILFRFLAGDEVEWAESGELAVHTGRLYDLAASCAGRRCVLLADGASVILAMAVVPARQRHTIMRAVPYVLEEQFAEEVENLHFAVGDRQPDGQTPVAAVRHSELSEWLGRCSECGIAVAAVIPEPLLVPWEEGAWSLLLDGNRGLIRQTRNGGFVVDHELISLALSRLRATGVDDAADDEASGSRELPELRVIAAADAAELRQQVEHYRGAVRFEETDVPPLALMAAGYSPEVAINLLQGPYSPKARIGRYLRPWRMAAALLIAVIGVQFTGDLVDRSRLRSRSELLSASIESIYRQAFPDARRVVNARAQMESRLRALKQSAGGSSNAFLQILAVSGPVLRSATGIKLTGINYRDGTLSLGVSAGSLQSVDQLREQLLSQAGLEVEIQSASSREGKVNSRLLIKEGAS
jgi:general secretion pathway protein L